jgi:hypothetical protein
MRYKQTEGETVTIIQKTGIAATIDVWTIPAGTPAALGTNYFTEITSTGIYTWTSGAITTQPTSFQEYAWKSYASGYNQYGKIVLHGYVEDVGTIKENTVGIAGTIIAIETDTQAIEVDTQNIQGVLTGIGATTISIEGKIDSILTDTGTTLPATLAGIGATVDTIDGIVDDILEDTGITLPSTLSDIETDTQAIEVDTQNIQGVLTGIGGTVIAIETDTQDIQSTLGGLNDVSVADIWDEPIAGHGTAGTYGGAIVEIMGLNHHNFAITGADYDATGNMTLGTVCLYSNAADVAANTNPIGTYLITAYYNGLGFCTNYLMQEDN